MNTRIAHSHFVFLHIVIIPDKLTSYRGVNLTYDAVGNPLSYYNGIGYNFTGVQGRRLETVTKSGQTYTYTYNADGIRTSKTVNGVKREYILNGTQILGEVWSDETTIIYIYDAEGYAVGMLYRDSSYEANKFDAFFYERNLMGDVIAVYSADGTKLISYTYDAWGNVSTTYATTDVMFTGPYYNPFTYRGYYRDSETGFYYLNSRYYDPKVGRFINADGIVAGNAGALQGYNLYAYCFNNPVNLTDSEGDWPSLKKLWSNTKKTFKKAANAVGNFIIAVGQSFEIEVGIGVGIGGSVSNNVTAEISRDTYVGVDDGDIITGNQISAELSVVEKIALGGSYNHLVEKGGDRVSSSGNAYDGPFDMINYPDVRRGNQASFLLYAKNDKGEDLISFEPSFHLGFGGYIKLSFNLTEFCERIKNI